MTTAPHTIDDIIEVFELFGDDWEERYRYLIDLGKTIPSMPDELKTDSYLVPGCTSKVWLAPEIENGVFRFQADSDAHIVRGLIALLLILFNERPAADIASMDVAGIFARLGLEQNLSPNRRNGFFSIVERIKALTSAL